MKRKGVRLSLTVLFVVFLSGSVSLFPDSGIYDRLGIWPESGYHGAVPEEFHDLFTGSLTLKFLDISLPGANGFDVNVYRVYNSKIMRDRLPGSLWGIQQEPYSYVGLGWSMHMGRVYQYDTDPIIEFPDGRWESAYPNANGSGYITRGFLSYDKSNYKLTFADGTTWYFGAVKTITYVGSSVQVRVVTQIENSYGHTIDIEYQGGSSPALKKITDSMGRTIDFVVENNRLSRIDIKNYQGNPVSYFYTVETFDTGGYYKLVAYQPPEILASTYEYYDGQYDHYELTAVNTSAKGRMEYDYDTHTFYYQVQPLETRVVTAKRLRFTLTGAFSTWVYTYPDYYNSDTGTVEVDGPEFDTRVTYHALSSANPYEEGWKIGLIKKKWVTDDSFIEEHEWTNHLISNTLWTVLNINLGPIRAPLRQGIKVTRLGDGESKEEYLYERPGVKNAGLPTRVNFYGGDEGETLKHYKTLEYTFETDSTFLSKKMFEYVKTEGLYSSGGTKLKETQTGYFTAPGKCGALEQTRRWKSGSTYLTWDYTYSGSSPDDIVITVDLPGSNAGIETYRYRWGVLAEIQRPGCEISEVTRSISAYNSAILYEINRHGGATYFTYDDLDRLTFINLPPGFMDIDVDWTWYSVRITQGANYITRYWDGLYRDTGYSETGGGMPGAISFRKGLDAEGRVISESKGSDPGGDKYYYVLNAAGNPTQITDPRGKVTVITYEEDEKTVTDAEQNQTVFYYEELPGLFSKLKDAADRYANYTYDGIGRLTQVRYNNARTQEYEYNGLDQVTSETHPETGTITYTYNPENNLWKKTWGGVTLTYTYKPDNQIHQVDTGEETITYDYDFRCRVNKVSSTNGWVRDQVLYNTLGSLTKERQDIPGLGLKTLVYTYDTHNLLESVTYPGNI